MRLTEITPEQEQELATLIRTSRKMEPSEDVLRAAGSFLNSGNVLGGWAQRVREAGLPGLSEEIGRYRAEMLEELGRTVTGQ